MIYARSTLSEVCAPRLFASIGGSTWFPRDFPERKPGEIEENRRPLQKKRQLRKRIRPDCYRVLPVYVLLGSVGFAVWPIVERKRKKEIERKSEGERGRTNVIRAEQISASICAAVSNPSAFIKRSRRVASISPKREKEKLSGCYWCRSDDSSLDLTQLPHGVLSGFDRLGWPARGVRFTEKVATFLLMFAGRFVTAPNQLGVDFNWLLPNSFKVGVIHLIRFNQPLTAMLGFTGFYRVTWSVRGAHFAEMVNGFLLMSSRTGFFFKKGGRLCPIPCFTEFQPGCVASTWRSYLEKKVLHRVFTVRRFISPNTHTHTHSPLENRVGAGSFKFVYRVLPGLASGEAYGWWQGARGRGWLYWSLDVTGGLNVSRHWEEWRKKTRRRRRRRNTKKKRKKKKE